MQHLPPDHTIITARYRSAGGAVFAALHDEAETRFAVHIATPLPVIEDLALTILQGRINSGDLKFDPLHSQSQRVQACLYSWGSDYLTTTKGRMIRASKHSRR